MNKTIGIYGDSYANLELDRDSSKSWVDILSETFHCVNHGSPGLSPLHCYKRFIDTSGSNYYNVFVIPNHHRIYCNYLETLLPDSINFNKLWYNNYEDILRIKNVIMNNYHQISNPEVVLRIADSVKTYYETWKDFECDELMHSVLINYLKQTAKNTLFINTLSPNDNIDDVGLLGLSNWELSQFGFNETLGLISGTQATRYSTDIRKNHLSEENNIILGKKIKHAIENNMTELKIQIKDFVKPAGNIDNFLRWIDV